MHLFYLYIGHVPIALYSITMPFPLILGTLYSSLHSLCNQHAFCPLCRVPLWRGGESEEMMWGFFFFSWGLNNSFANALFSLISVSMRNKLASWRRNSGFYFLLLEWLSLTNSMEWPSKWGTTVDEIKNRYSMRFFFVSLFFCSFLPLFSHSSIDVFY
jgi:hypothetical protein